MISSIWTWRIQSQSRKSNAYARTLIKSAIPRAAKGGAEVSVRINHHYVEADLEAVVWPDYHG